MASQSVRLLKRLLVVGTVAVLSLWLASSVLAALPTDTTIADFTGAGTDVGSCSVGPSTWDGGVGGEVFLSPLLATGFPGTNVPGDWYTGTYDTAYPVIAADFITAEVSYAGVTAASGPTLTLEFEATFTGQSQWVGFAWDTRLDNTPWALFGTFGSGTDLYANTAYVSQTQVITGELGVPHRFRIDWLAGLVNYYIDDALVAAHTVEVAVPMRPLIADNSADSNLLVVDWLRMGPYAPTSCTYTSHLFDSGYVNPNWITLTTSIYVPANTTLSFETRSGDTATAGDATWSGWYAVSSGGAIDTLAPDRRYLQYQAVLATTDPLATPRIYSVQPQGLSPTAVTVADVEGRPASHPLGEWSILLAGGLGILGLGLIGYRARQARKTSK
jgi:large repetitive protein